ncbi:hypothetical protein TWF718_009552 [Orbilia javanica]|uniref:Uncharacterized protein n=1 Tax=Orbilia javanica TaxID=47235 RepID=A0AAN8RBJ6_9PEZI
MKLKNTGGWPLLILVMNNGIFVEAFKYKNLNPIISSPDNPTIPLSPEVGRLVDPGFAELGPLPNIKYYNLTGEIFNGQRIDRNINNENDRTEVITEFSEIHAYKSATTAFYTTDPKCPVRVCRDGGLWQYRFCMTRDMEDLSGVQFYQSDFTYTGHQVAARYADDWNSIRTELLPHLPRASESEPLVFARFDYRYSFKNGTIPSEEEMKLPPYEVQILFGGCTPEEIKRDGLELSPSGDSSPSPTPQQKMATIKTATITTATQPAEPATLMASAKPTKSVQSGDVPLENRGWYMKCFAEPYSMPFKQNSNLSTIFNIKEKIKTGSLKPVFDYKQNPKGNCRQHYCDPSSDVKVSLCSEESISYDGNLYLPELIEKALEGLKSDACYEGRRITSDPKFYRVSNLQWVCKDMPGVTIGPEVTIGQLEAGMSCDAFISRLQQTPSRPNLGVAPSVYGVSSTAHNMPMPTAYDSPPSPPAPTTVKTYARTSTNTTEVEIPPPQVKQIPYYERNFAKTGKGGNSLWLFKETEQTGGLDPNCTLKLQRGLYKTRSDEKFKTFQKFPDFIVKLPADREAFEGDCTHYYCDDSSKALVSMCGKWWNGLPAPYAETIMPSYNVNAGRLIAKTRWLTYFCNTVDSKNLEWANSCDYKDYNTDYQLERMRPSIKLHKLHIRSRGLVRDFSPEAGMIGPSAFKVESLSLYGFDNCYDWNQTLFRPGTSSGTGITVLYNSGRRYKNVKEKPSTSLTPPENSASTLSTQISSPTAPTDSLSTVLETTVQEASPTATTSKWRLEPAPTLAGSERPDPREHPPSEDPDWPWQ